MQKIHYWVWNLYLPKCGRPSTACLTGGSELSTFRKVQFSNTAKFRIVFSSWKYTKKNLPSLYKMQSQRSSQNRTVKKILFFFSFWPLLLHQCITFSFFLVQIERFKLLWNGHLKLYKSSCNSEGNKIIFKDFLRGSKINYELFDWEFFVQTTPSTSKGCNFFISSPFLLILSVIDAQRGGLFLLFEHHKQWGPPAKMGPYFVLWPASLLP